MESRKRGVWGVASVLTRRAGARCVASEAILGRFAMTVFATRYADGVAHEDAWGCLVACGNVLYQRRPHSQQCQLVDIGVLQLPRRVESTYTFWSKKTKRKSTVLLVFYRSAVLQKFFF